MAATDGMVKGVDFVAFQTKDFDRAMTFYGETLALSRSVHVPERGFAEFETGNLTLSILDSAKMGMEHVTAPRPASASRRPSALRPRTPAPPAGPPPGRT
jgi:hypothetical protein